MILNKVRCDPLNMLKEKYNYILCNTLTFGAMNDFEV